VCHLGALQIVILRCPRTHSGRASVLQGRSVCTVTTVGVHGCGGRCTPSAVSRTATDGPRWRRIPGLTRAAEPGAHPRVPSGGPVIPQSGGRGRAGALMARAAVRESMTDAGRAARARVASGFADGVPGPVHPCGDVAVLLVTRELFGNSVQHSGSGDRGETVTIAVMAGLGPGRGH
jgi:hypothetical protein